MATNHERLARYYDTNDFSGEAAQAVPENCAPAGAPAEPMDAFTLKLPVALLGKIRALAAEKGLSTGEMLRDIIKNGFADETDASAQASKDHPHDKQG